MTAIDCVLLGRLQRDIILTADGQARLDQLGGNLAYAASACQLSGARAGLVARVGADYPQEWLEALAARGLRVDGVQRLETPADQLRFIAYPDVYQAHSDHPVKHFAQWGLPLPKALLHYTNPDGVLDSKQQRGALTLRPEDFPAAYQGAKAAHLCAMEYLSHAFLPVALREAGIGQIVLESHPGYMHPEFWKEFPDLVNGIAVFVTTEDELNSLFRRQNADVWAMAEGVCSFNCQAVIVRNPARGDQLYEAASGGRWHLPPFPARTYDITDNTSSFCGALAGRLAQGDPVSEALITASAVASLAEEGNGVFHVVEAFPGLLEARMEALRQALKPV